MDEAVYEGTNLKVGETDPIKWAAEFNRIFEFTDNSDKDRYVLWAWFSNAIQAGRDHTKAKVLKAVEEL